MVSVQADCLASPKETRNIKHKRIKKKMRINLTKPNAEKDALLCGED